MANKTVLLVEDEPLMLELLSLQLQREGFTVIEASNGEEALEKARDHQGSIDLLISDYVMPRINGPELALQLKGSQPQIQTLIVSGLSEWELEEKLTHNESFLCKPFSPKDFTRKIQEVVSSPVNS